jgi:tRNA-2-methylthio-N6-dimethylallyladenosine synthase
VNRPFEDILVEVATLAAQGVREVNLLGQNVNAYRGAIGEDGDTADLALLISYMAEIEGIERIRYTTSHPMEMTDSLINVYKTVPKLVSHLHLPVQSGSDRILSLMKRGHTAIEYKQKIRQLREVRPDLGLSSDFIVGFPGETEEDFQATLKLIDEMAFDHSFSFIYSPRPGTPAADMPDDVDMEVKKQRLQILQARLNELEAMYSRRMVGTVQKVLVEREASRKDIGQLAGHTENNRVVNFEADASLIGQFVQVRITEALRNSLRGELVTA